MPGQPRLLSLATAVPPYRLRQAEVMARARNLFRERPDEIERMLPVYDNAGIDTRYSCVPLEWYEENHGWKERNGLYIDHVVALGERVAAAALKRARLGVDGIDAVLSVSSTGIATPSLDALVAERMGLRRDVQRLPVFGLGCAGGVIGLARAAALARAAPETKILLLVVELCGLTFRQRDQSKSNIIATALFGDGAAAAVVACDGEGPCLADSGEYTWPASLPVMGWHVEEDGFGVLFSRDIPALVRQDLRAVVDAFLESRGLSLADIDGFICHPGGAKVVAALEDAFDLSPGSLLDTRAVLRDFGNMSAPTVLFVLERVLGIPAPGRYLMSALGPGFTAAFMIIDIPEPGAAATP